MSSPRLLLPLALALLPACKVGLAEATAEPTGCDPEDIEITNARQSMMGGGAPPSWEAKCGGIRYYCIQARTRTICSTDSRDAKELPGRPG